MPLTVCLLVRNEESQIQRAIGSVKPIADDIVVVDLGSGDRTQAVAADAGARVVNFTWTEDFSAARHFAVFQASGKWILWINASEELLPESHEPLRSCMQREDAAAFFVRIRNRISPDRPTDTVETAAIRLWRNRPDLRFEGRLHPHLAPDFANTLEREGKKVDGSEIILLNHDLEYAGGKWTHEKLRFNARLLELELRDRPGQLHYEIEYGRTLLHLDEQRGHELLARATEKLASTADTNGQAPTKAQVLFEYLLQQPNSPARQKITADRIRELILRWFPNSPRLLYPLAEERFRAGDVLSATALLERLIHLGNTATYDRSTSFDPAVLRDDSLINLAACYRRQGRWDDAERCYRRLLTSAKYSKQATEGIAALEHLRSQGK